MLLKSIKGILDSLDLRNNYYNIEDRSLYLLFWAASLRKRHGLFHFFRSKRLGYKAPFTQRAVFQTQPQAILEPALSFHDLQKAKCHFSLPHKGCPQIAAFSTLLLSILHPSPATPPSTAPKKGPLALPLPRLWGVSQLPKAKDAGTPMGSMFSSMPMENTASDLVCPLFRKKPPAALSSHTKCVALVTISPAASWQINEQFPGSSGKCSHFSDPDLGTCRTISAAITREC